MTNNELRIELMEREIEALRSVLSEWEHEDKSCFVQMLAADAIAEVLKHIKYGEQR